MEALSSMLHGNVICSNMLVKLLLSLEKLLSQSFCIDILSLNVLVINILDTFYRFHS